MTPKDAMIHQINNLQGKPLKQKCEHIFTYFGIPIVVILAVLVFVVSNVVSYSLKKETVLNITCINSLADTDHVQVYVSDFAKYAGIDLDNSEVNLLTNYYLTPSDPMASYDTAQVILAQIVARTIDIMAADTDTVMEYAYQEAFMDLRTVLSPEQQEKYAEHFLYMDYALLPEMQSLEKIPTAFPNPTEPTAMREPIPVALLLPSTGEFSNLCFANQFDGVAVGIIANAENLSNAILFVDYIME